MFDELKVSAADKATIIDVAAVAGVSTRTVSRVLNRSPMVNSETRARVEKIIGDLNFRPSLRARGLAMKRSYLIGMVHNDRNALVLDAVLRGIVDATAARGYELVVHPTRPGDVDTTTEVINFVTQSRVDGVVVLPPVSEIEGLPAALAALKVPAVALSSVHHHGYASVIVSEERLAATDVARYLIALGHTRLAMISGPSGTISAQERCGGFLSALDEAGLQPLKIVEGDYGFRSGVTAAECLLALTPRPTAIFSANDVMAAGLLKVAAARGIAIPGMLSVVGFDGSLLAEMLTPSLTTVNRPFGEMARAATEKLFALLEGESAITRNIVRLNLLEAGSSGPPPPQF